ncbi:BadF/BadG/BcrA/BcrD ATPase family protein [Raoultibacter phocaeensis]|uniref:BadF/BadG/BcrA/BcrD ATPase family protein n=1 Tax=Raoultibacter phocaeensis TaxID=2479841 RepID=UPI00111841D3|nr:BadF/BadG/BcrA/BcrD ATPase family protein [Raoultibacter phocaeensis]
MAFRIGIDAGSKTIKVVVLDESGAIERSAYRRHRADIKTTLGEVVHDLVWRYGDAAGTVAVTGSAGIELAAALGLPFVQEVVATTYAVQNALPQADAIIELGGEDAKVVYLSGGLEQRMNATCAGGTGGFIDTIAFMLGVSSREMSSLAMGATKTYPIASRCAVFAQTDVRPLLNAGAKKTDIAASALDAVVKQTLGGLACGRPITGTVVFLGGPLEHIASLVHRFRAALGLDHRTGIKPANAHLFTALGAALAAGDPARLDESPVETSLVALEAALKNTCTAHDDLARLAPLFSSDDEYEAFRARHEMEKVPRRRIADTEGTVYLGIDAGSTAVKLALIDDDERLLYSDYRPVEGNVLAAASAMLLDLYRALPNEYDGTPLVRIAHATVTGYGERLLKTAFGIDSGVVETTAHLRAARAFRPNVSFVLDIGGQDMKALWTDHGAISKAVLNEACSSGCGSFVEGSAHSLRCTPYSFSDLAVKAPAPVDLGTKCTVFMTSRVRHAQKIGVSYGDISAGIAYSVVNNALFKVIGLDNLDSLGNEVVVQGGTFLSDAVLRAFELVTKTHALRPDIAHLMGAYGAALVARSRAGSRPSTLSTSEEIAVLEPRFRSETCPGCANACALSIVTFEQVRERAPKNSSQGRAIAERARTPHDPNSAAPPRCFVDGNRCERAYGFFENTQGRIGTQGKTPSKAPNTVALEQGLLFRFADCEGNEADGRGHIVVGLPSTLNDCETIPFWHTLMVRLGFSVSTGFAVDLGSGGIDTIPSESVCYPAKIGHERIFSLIERGANVVFMPVYHRGSHCPVSSLYARAVNDSMPLLHDGTTRFASPELASLKPAQIVSSEEDRAALFAAVNSFAPGDHPVCLEEFDCALTAALAEQEAFACTMRRACEKALSWIEAEQAHGIVLAGRPYHADSALCHGIDAMLASLGFAVLSPVGLDELARSAHKALRNPASSAPATTEASLDTYSADTAAPARKAEAPLAAGEDGALASHALWKQGKRLGRLAAFTATRRDIDMVCLQSFGCAFDAVSLLEAKQVLEAADHPFTALKVDEIADTAHVLIRLRTLADTIEGRKGAETKRATSGGGFPSPPGRACASSSESRMSASAPHIASRTAAENPSEAESAPSFPGHPQSPSRSVALGRIEREDVEVGRQEVSQDICSTVAAVAGRIIRLSRADPHIDTVIVDEGCVSCLFDALPELVRFPLGRDIAVVLKRQWSAGEAPPRNGGGGFERQPAHAAAPSKLSKAPTRKPRIGIIGNPYLTFERALNDDLLSLIESLDCEAVLPHADKLLVDDVRYLDQLRIWNDRGIDHVVYAQSFGCLKGHIESRGALRELKERFPNLSITVIDYDPDASALNRKNRILLVAEAAKKRNAHASDEL